MPSDRRKQHDSTRRRDRPHQDTFTVGVVDCNGVELSHDSFSYSASGYLDAIDLLHAHGVCRIGVEGSASWGAHVAIAVVAAGFDAREVPAQRSATQRRARRLDKTDTVDAYATARALLAEPTLGPVQTLEVYNPLVAKVEAVLEHRRALVGPQEARKQRHIGPSGLMPKTGLVLRAVTRRNR